MKPRAVSVFFFIVTFDWLFFVCVFSRRGGQVETAHLGWAVRQGNNCKQFFCASVQANHMIH
jgi:hypothetical protein